MKKLVAILLALTFVLGMAACAKTEAQPAQQEDSTTAAPAEATQEDTAAADSSSEKPADKPLVIGVAQCHLNTPYRVALTTELQDFAKAYGHENWEFIITDGKNDPTTQINNVYDLIAAEVDVIVMAPTQADPLTPVCKEILDAGIPLVLVDRSINSDDFTAFVGGDNVEAGAVIGQWIVDTYGTEDDVYVFNMQGTLGSSANNDRQKGFTELVANYPNIKIVSDVSADYKRDLAMSVMEDTLQAFDKIDVVYCGSDNMALGAIQAIEAAGRAGEIAVWGTDGQKDAADKIKSGEMAGTVIYPTGAEGVIQVIEKIINGEDFERIQLLPVPVVTADNVDEMYDSCF